MSALRVAMVTSSYLPNLGGVETHVDEVARRMVARGLDLTVLTTDETHRLPTREHRGELTVKRFPAWPPRSDLSASLALPLEVAHAGYDLVHVQGVHTLLPPMTLAAAQRAGIPTVVTFHTGGHSSRLRTAVREAQWQTLGPLLRRSSALIAVCKYEVEQFARRLGVDPESIELIRNGAGRLPVDGSRLEMSGSPLITSVGRLERYKGHHRVVEAMPALLEKMPDAHLALVGRGSYERQLRRLVARLGIERSVTFRCFGSRQRAGLGAVVRASDIVLLLSDYEANPIAVMEALALGTKVVVARTSGLTELASEGLVTAVPPDVPPIVLAGILARVAALPDDAPPDLPNWDDCVDRLLALYTQIAGRRAPALRSASAVAASGLIHRRRLTGQRRGDNVVVPSSFGEVSVGSTSNATGSPNA